MQIELCFFIVILHQIIGFNGENTDDNSKSNEDNFILSKTKNRDFIKKEKEEYKAEQNHGDMADLIGTNQHHYYPDYYKNLGRRFVLEYPYKEVSNIDEGEEAENVFDNIAKDFLDTNLAESHLIPVKAPPELVLAVAAKGALLDAAIPRHPLKEELIDKEILRSGNYWNNVWREDVNPEILRTPKNNVQSVTVKVMPGSKLYNLVSELKKISPRLVYVINKE